MTAFPVPNVDRVFPAKFVGWSILHRFQLIPDRVTSLNKTGQTQSPNPGREINFEALWARALKSSIVGKDDVSAIVANLPPVGEHLHRPESGAGGAVRAASFLHFPGGQGSTLRTDDMNETSKTRMARRRPGSGIES